MRGDCYGGCVGIPLSVEVEVGVLAKCLDPLVRGGCGCLALCLSLNCEVDFVWLSALPLV